MNTLTEEELRIIHKAMKQIEDHAKSVQRFIEAELQGKTVVPILFMHDIRSCTEYIANDIHYATDITRKS